MNVKMEDGGTWKSSAPEIFYRTGEDFIYYLGLAHVINEQEAHQFSEDLKKWWHDNMGDIHPPAD